MSMTRAFRLIGAIEAGTVTGAELESLLEDAGRASEFNVLLAMTGQARRMAASPLTMSVISASTKAIGIVYQQATAGRHEAVESVTNSVMGMAAAAASKPVLIALATNPVAWGYFKKSLHYDINLPSILANYANLPVVVDQTVTNLITNPVSMGDISANINAMRAVVASSVAIATMAGNAVAMAAVSDSQDAIKIVAEETAIMSIIAASTTAMTEIVTREFAVNQMAINSGAIQAIAASPSAWAAYLAGGFFAANLPVALANLIGVSPTAFPSLASIIADPIALGKVAANKSAVEALASNSAAMTILANSPNIGIILGSTIAMAVIGPNTTAMGSFLGASGAWAGLFASSIAKGFIVASTALVNIVASNTALIDFLKTIAVTTSATGIPDGNATSLQSFTGLPSKVLTLTAKEAGIAATFSPYNFGGSLMTGSQAGATLSLTSVANLPHVAGYTSMTWNLQGIGVTAATLPIITYVSMI